jgi:L-asparaginase
MLLLHTGGTIAMSEDKTTGFVATKDINPLHETLPEIAKIAAITSDDYLNLPSPHVTPDIMFKLSMYLRERIEQDQFEGIVITHGTDTIEETAYLLDLIMNVKIPIILTGAMRSSNELGSDGPYNLISSIRVAASQEAHEKGVLVVFNDEIHSAKNATKTHTSNIATFQSPQYGPIGIVTKRDIFFHHKPIRRDCYEIEQLTKKVVLLKAYAGMDPELLAAVRKLPVDGLVIEALGQGNLPPNTVSEIIMLLKENIPVVLVSRCFNGIVQDIYSYIGGGKHLKDLGVIFTNGLSGQKARLKLMVTLEKTTDVTELQELFLN